MFFHGKGFISLPASLHMRMEMRKHYWSVLLNSLQLVTTPLTTTDPYMPPTLHPLDVVMIRDFLWTRVSESSTVTIMFLLAG